ncbi:MAG: hypothetical protein JXR31_11745 [Prolixibacteraceae bacterium]|nr:hypothetical protein [Prolixibacteraceae bacterium]MBN2774917.1 hypothetical protein [Prolixibacteraceae bacterium]
MERREFVKNSGRWVILGGIGIITAILAINHQIAGAAECKVSPVCKGCQKFTHCNLPQAEKQRENGKES